MYVKRGAIPSRGSAALVNEAGNRCVGWLPDLLPGDRRKTMRAEHRETRLEIAATSAHQERVQKSPPGASGPAGALFPAVDIVRGCDARTGNCTFHIPGNAPP